MCWCAVKKLLTHSRSWWDSNPRPLSHWSETLPLRHRATRDHQLRVITYRRSEWPMLCCRYWVLTASQVPVDCCIAPLSPCIERTTLAVWRPIVKVRLISLWNRLCNVVFVIYLSHFVGRGTFEVRGGDRLMKIVHGRLSVCVCVLRQLVLRTRFGFESNSTRPSRAIYTKNSQGTSLLTYLLTGLLCHQFTNF